MQGELWNDDTGELLCRNTAQYGNSTSGSDPMQEKGYVVGIPPCVWGSEEEGLLPPPMIHLDTNLSTIKRAMSHENKLQVTVPHLVDEQVLNDLNL